MKRNLHEDLAICEAASLGKYAASADEWPGNANLRHWVSDHYDGIGCFIRYEDAQFDAEAREGWPEAIRRAINAEAELIEWKTSAQEVEDLAEYLRDENKRLRKALELMDDRKNPMIPRSQMARIAKEALGNGTY